MFKSILFLVLLSLITACSAANSTFPNSYSDYTDIQNRTRLIPWDWAVQRILPDGEIVDDDCASSGQILLMFALVNIVCSAVSLVFSNAIIARTITSCLGRYAFGRQDYDPYHKIRLFFPVLMSIILQLGGCFVNALFIQRTSGYKQVDVVQLALLFAARPRLSWIIINTLWSYKSYRKSAASSALTEAVMQLIGAYTMGKTAHFAATNKYYLAGHHKMPHGKDAYNMYAGALAYLIMLLFSASSFFMVTGPSVYQKVEARESELGLPSMSMYTERENSKWEGFRKFSQLLSSLICWGMSWVFWAGFIKLSGPL